MSIKKTIKSLVSSIDNLQDMMAKNAVTSFYKAYCKTDMYIRNVTRDGEKITIDAMIHTKGGACSNAEFTLIPLNNQ